MAKKNKKLSKRKQVELLKKQGLSFKEARRLPKENRIEITELIITDSDLKSIEKAVKKATTQKPKKVKKSNYDAFKFRVSQKRMYLDSIGVKGALERGVFSDKKIDSIKLKDIENNNVSRENYKWLFVSDSFDFNQIYSLKNNNRMFIAFRDYQGELDISDALAQFSKYNDGALIDFLEHIVNTPASYQKGVSGSSSGKAGSYRFMIAPQKVIETFNKDTYNESKKDKRFFKNQDKKTKRKSKRQQYKGDNVGFQVLKDGNRVSFSEVTPRNLLVMANAIMHNITEKDRVNFYTRFYDDITKNIPDMKEILPKP